MGSMKLQTIALALLLSPSVWAQPPSEALRPLLLGIDSVPTAAQLRAAVPDAEAQLSAAARDKALGAYPRQRAVSLLTVLGGEQALAAIIDLTATGDEVVRAAAAYSLGRGFGASAPDAALATLRLALDEPAAHVRQAAARALRWVDRPSEVQAALEARAAREPDEATRRVIAAALGRLGARP